MKELKSIEAFHDMVQSGKTVIEFYADWCTDCKRIEPNLDTWADQFAGQFAMARINCEEVPEIAEQFEVVGIPSFLAFDHAKLVNRLYSRDAKSKQQVESYLQSAFDV
ncbi:thioredoxin family protein [Ferroacidibacillus organovorans]|uniref:Thiol reductase thioredoxin n=1 Tax=Ferroacidibacillus organovorans TaxID=1765683 RepID=A0A162UB55_9BACL|nr:thioredoxin family protein [Ferroacidibacillus organovorans]KYP81613.1 thiol reductase thioredoxin [Ferroacidibacillus organovorans]OAG94960.1 thiol-disulfide isomerase [Ferroacidibacillus organovorans]OPG14962.1 thiol reductase thioredoxin [Ferroacidibacillus organovorans]